MNRQFAMSVGAIFVMAFALGFLVHGVLLYGEYMMLPNLMRPMADANARMPLMAVAYASFAVAFTWIYLKGRESKPWLAQGARYGFAIALLTVVPMYLIYHVVSPYPFSLAIKQIVFEGIAMVLLGIALAWLNR